MSDDQINIAIAEWCGWKEGTCGWWSGPNGEEVVHLPNRSGLPSYTTDLNAMHEAETHLKEKHGEWWIAYCCKVCEEFDPDYVAIHATARQRAEALLRTVGKWKE